MSVLSVLAENDPLTECKCKNEPTVCNQYSTDNTCVDSLPNLASPLDEAPDIIAKKYDYYNFGSEWTATYCGGKPKRHVGVDLGVKFEEGKKIPVYAVTSGQVKADYLCSPSYDWARGIVIDHDGAFTTVYEHISPLVSVGQHVDKGQQIATVAKIEGNYQHLHFGIKCGGYEVISTRGALPVEHGPCDKKIDCSTSGCRCDPLFPGPFIDPLDTRIVYEQYNPPQESIQSESFSGSLNLDLPTIPSESALSTTPMLDEIHPTVQAFQVTTQSLAVGESFAIEYTVSDTGGSGLNRIELWRKDERGDWQEIKRNALSGNGPTSGSFLDAPSNLGKYWYGIHVVDNAGNWNDEKNSNSINKPDGFEPFEVDVKSFERSISRAASEQDHEAILSSGWDIFSCPISSGSVIWRIVGNTLQVKFQLNGADPNHEYTLMATFFDPDDKTKLPDLNQIPGWTDYGTSVAPRFDASRDGRTASGPGELTFGHLNTDSKGDGISQFDFILPPGTYYAQFTVRRGECWPGKGDYSGCSVVYRTGNKFGESFETIVIT